jgi:hypothetical protein
VGSNPTGGIQFKRVGSIIGLMSQVVNLVNVGSNPTLPLVVRACGSCWLEHLSYKQEGEGSIPSGRIRGSSIVESTRWGGDAGS